MGPGLDAWALNVPLTVRETAGAARTGEIVTTGVPIPKGQLSSDQAASISGTDGQFQTLATWGDGSVKWLLVSFPATVSANGSATYSLVNGGGNAPAGPMNVSQTSAGVTVNTGPLRFTMKSSGFNLFDEVWLDSNHDGSFSAAERIVSPRSTNGSVIEAPGGDRFTSVQGPSIELVVEEIGPLRAVIAFEGVHAGSSGNHLNFSGRVYAYRNRSDVRVQFSRTNMIPTDTYSSGSQPLCRWFEGQGPVGGTHNSLHLEDISLVTRVDLLGSPRFSIQGSPTSAPQGGNLSGDAFLYQDSSGGPYWHVSGGTTFSGYRIQHGGSTLSSGSQAEGYADLNDGSRGLAVAVQHFWENFPGKLLVSPDGTVTIGMMPRDFSDPYEIRPGERKTNRLLYYFHDGDAASAGVENLAKGFQSPLRAMASAQYYADSRAFDDLVPYNPSEFGDYEQNNEPGPDGFLDAREDSDFYGWQDFGDLWSDFEGGGLPPNTNNAANNMEYDSGFAFLQQSLRTAGIRDDLSDKWWDLAWAGNEHTADIDIYHVTDGPLQWLWGGMWNHTGHGYSGYEDAHRGMSPNAAHTWNRGMFTWYYLSGDRQVLDGALKVSENIRWRIENGPGMPGISQTDGEERAPGHSLQMMLDTYLHTWDTRWLTAARKVVTESHANTKDFVQSPFSGSWRCKPWMLAILMRNLGRFAEVMQAEKGIVESQAVASLLAYADFMEKKAWTDRTASTPGFIAYQVSGDGSQDVPGPGGLNVNMWTLRNSDAFTYATRFESDPSRKLRYREIAQVSFEDGGAYPWCFTCPRFEYMQAKVQQVTAGSGQEWMKEAAGGGSSDTVPPAAITNLTAGAGDGGGEIDLHWSAPGDDGMTGRAARYIVRRAAAPITSEGAWSSATTIAGPPIPGTPGTAQAMTISGFEPGVTHYFAIRAQDEALNTGDLSNSPGATAGQESTPPVISDIAAGIDSATLNVLVVWATNELANGRVDYGPTSSYGSSTPLNPELTTSHFFTIEGIPQGQTLHYRVRSADQFGNEAVSGDRTIVVAVDNTAPSYTMDAPIFGVGTAKLTFHASEVSFGSFHWGVGNVNEHSLPLGSIESPAVKHVAQLTGLVPQTTYQTKIVLVDMSGNVTEESSTLFFPGAIFDTTPPAAPSGLKIAQYSRALGVQLQWNPNSETDMAGYNVHRRSVSADGNALGDWALLNADLVTEVTYSDETIDANVYWEYAVTALDESENESARSLPVTFNPERWAGSDLVAVNFPNPFRLTSGTQISFRTPAIETPSNVKMHAYDVNGRRVKLLYSGPSTAGKTRTVRWDGTDQYGNALSPGVYFYRLEAGDQTIERKMILLR